MNNLESKRSERRAAFARAYILLVVLVTIGVGVLWFHNKAVPEELGAIVGLVVGAIMTGLNNIIKFMFGEEAAQAVYNKRGENDENETG